MAVNLSLDKNQLNLDNLAILSVYNLTWDLTYTIFFSWLLCLLLVGRLLCWECDFRMGPTHAKNVSTQVLAGPFG